MVLSARTPFSDSFSLDSGLKSLVNASRYPTSSIHVVSIRVNSFFASSRASASPLAS